MQSPIKSDGMLIFIHIDIFLLISSAILSVWASILIKLNSGLDSMVEVGIDS